MTTTPPAGGLLRALGSRGRIVVAFLAGILVALLVVGAMLLSSQRTDRTTPPAPPPSPFASPSPSIDPDAGDYEHDHDTAEDEKAQWEPAVLGFARNFTHTTDKSPTKWRARLAPFVAPAVRDQLAEVDIAKVPAGVYDSYEVLTPGAYQLAVKVTYREGWAMVLYVTSDGADTWTITAYDKWEQ